MAKLGAYNEPAEVYSNIANSLSEQTVFPPERPEMYFYVREPCAGISSSADFESEGQGFARNLEFLSELIDGRINIDGLQALDISLGDTFTVSVNPETALKGIKFIV